jgi:hypothetical protein
VHLPFFSQSPGQSLERHRTLWSYTSSCRDYEWREVTVFDVANAFEIFSLLPLLVHREAACKALASVASGERRKSRDIEKCPSRSRPEPKHAQIASGFIVFVG